ncbi:radical SAM protein [Dissulfurimicrobium hydrothermale]|nr:radical SAM protein [Dissulfurimicrobium hydrothermale]UKL14652.1 radical SAM protein [Dissulfurimicrobium hydrothermale]
MINITPDRSRHPCFNASVKGSCGRVHLPVAPKCNILCNYCNRKYDCVNESRPGVTSAILSPYQALAYMERVIEKEPRITVAGIAGPGDPFASPDETIETIRLIKERFPEIILCLATNGLGVSPYVDDLASLGVSHITVTINAVDPDVSQNIYAWVRDGKVVYRGREAAGLLLQRQLDAVSKLKARGITLKINTIVIPGINYDPEINGGHIIDIAKKMAEMGADVLNCMPMYPNAGTAFENIREPDKKEIRILQDRAGEHIAQMRHCTRCRADAIGLLGEDRSTEMHGCLSACASLPKPLAGNERPFVAVATLEGMLVNQHLGEAERLQIWGRGKDGFYLVEERRTPLPGGGPKRWEALSEMLRDCRAILVGGIGENPRNILSGEGIEVFELNGFIEMGLKSVFMGDDISFLKVRRKGGCGGCKGAGLGCDDLSSLPIF